MRKRACLALLCALLLCALAGCGEMSHAPSPSSSASATPSPVQIAGGEVRIGMPQALGRAHPLFPETRQMASINGMLFEGLFRLDAQGKPEPNLAQSYALEQQEGACVWTFKLRQGVQWHGGQGSFSASDAAYTINTLLSEAGNASIYAPALKRAGISAVEAPDASTLVLRTASPQLSLLEALTCPIVPAAVYQGKEADNPQSVGSGPFQLGASDASQIVLAANSAWWRSAPTLERVVVQLFPDDDAVLASFSLRQIDMALCADITAGKYRSMGDTQVIDVRTRTLEQVVFNLGNTFFSDPSVRSAVCYATNSNEIMSQVYLSRASGVDVPIPRDSWLYDVQLRRFDLDLDKANKLLREAGWADTDGDGIVEKDIGGARVPFSFKLTTNGATDEAPRVEAAKLMREQLKKVGIDMQIEVVDIEQVKTKLAGNGYDAVLTGIVVDDVPDLQLLYGSGAPRSSNVNGFSSAAVDEALGAVASAQGESGYRSAVLAACARIMDEAPTMPLFYHNDALLVRDDIQNVRAARELSMFMGAESWAHVQMPERTPEETAAQAE
nr:peptide ABC transporter substrate-binding protein [Maliibacterium massiliense]